MLRLHHAGLQVPYPVPPVWTSFESAVRHARSTCSRKADGLRQLHESAQRWPVPDWLRLEIVSLWFFLTLIALTFFL